MPASTSDPARRSAPAARADDPVGSPPDRCPPDPDDVGLDNHIIAGHRAPIAISRAAAHHLFADSGQSPLARTFTGRAYVFGKFFAGLGECSGGSLSIEIGTVVANDQTIVVLPHHDASHGGRTTRRARDRRVRHPWRSGCRSPQHEHRALCDERFLRSTSHSNERSTGPVRAGGDTLPRWHGGQAAAAHERH